IINQQIMNDMETVRGYVNQGLSLRAKAKIKVRQPLKSVTVPKIEGAFDFVPILLEELNVKRAIHGRSQVTVIDLAVTPELEREGKAREVIRNIQNARKEADMDVADRIRLGLTTANEDLKHAIEDYQELIMSETLAMELTFGTTHGHKTDCAVDGAPLT